MIRLDLSPAEIEILVATLYGEVSDLSYEISNTDRLDFRNRLKLKKALLQRVARALAEAGAESGRTQCRQES